MKQHIEKITIGIFFGTIAILSVTNLFAPKKTYSFEENRTLTKAPELSAKKVFSGDFDDEFEKWFADHFVGRKNWILTKSAIKKSTGFLDNNDVYYGKNDTLIKEYLTIPYKTLNQNCDIINEFLEENQLHANIMLVPTAAWCNEVNLPNGAYTVDQEALLQDLKQRFENANFIPSLSRSADAIQDYFKTDHHWNANGALKGYESICKNVLNKKPNSFTTTLVSNNFYGTMYSRSGAFWTKPDEIYRIDAERPIDVTVTMEDEKQYSSIYFDQRLKEKDQYMYYLDGNHPIVKIKTSLHTNKKAVIVKDSYAHILMPYLISEYDEIDLIDLRYYRQPVSELIKDKEHTDLYFIYSLDNFSEDPNIAFLR